MQLGAVNMDRVFIQHPISDQTTEQLHAKADAAIPEIVSGLLSNTPLVVLDAQAPVSSELKPEEEECGA